jgi:hypothetical protein
MALFCLKELGFLPPPPFIVQVYLSVMRDLSILYIGGKLVAAVSALYFCYISTLPKKSAV